MRKLSLLLLAGLGFWVAVTSTALADAPMFDSYKKKFQSEMSENDRWTSVTTLLKEADAATDIKTIKAYLTLSEKMKPFLTDFIKVKDIGQEYILDEFSKIVRLCYRKLATDASTTLAEFKVYFAQIDSDDTRSEIVGFWKKEISTAKTKERTTELNNLLIETGKMIPKTSPQWLHTKVALAIDESAHYYFARYQATALEYSTIFKTIVHDTSRIELFNSLINTIQSSSDVEFLKNISEFIADALEQADSTWQPITIEKATIAHTKANKSLVNSNSVKSVEKAKYFTAINGDATKLEFIKELLEKSRLVITKQELLSQNEMFVEILKSLPENPAPNTNAAYLNNHAAASIGATATRLFKEFTLTSAETEAIFFSIRDSGTRAEIFDFFINDKTRHTDIEHLKRAFDLIEKAMKDTRDWETWAVEKGNWALEVVSIKLVKNPKINSADMSRYFEGIKSEGGRTALLEYWSGVMNQYHTKDDLLALARFFSNTEESSRAGAYDEWLISKSIDAQRQVNQLILDYAPVYEGVYEVVLTAQKDKTRDYAYLNRLVIVNTATNEGLWVSLSNEMTGKAAFAFANVQVLKGSTVFESVARRDNALSKIHLVFDPETKKITGNINDGEISIAGTLKKSTIQIHEAQGDLPAKGQEVSLSEIESATFSGKIKDSDATLKISTKKVRYKTEALATLTMSPKDSKTPITVLFSSGRYNEKNGILTLAGTSDQGTALKLTLGVTRVKDGGRDLKANALIVNAATGTMSDIIEFTAEK